MRIKIVGTVLDRRTKKYRLWLHNCMAAAEANCYPVIVKKKDLMPL